MQAFFADVKQWGVYSDYGYTPNPELKGWTNDHPFPPEIEVENAYLRRRYAKLQEQVAQIVSASTVKLQADEKQRVAFESWKAEIQESFNSQSGGYVVPTLTAEVISADSPKKKSAKAKTADKVAAKTVATKLDDDGLIRLTAVPKKGDELRIQLDPAVRRIGSIQLDLVPDPEGSIRKSRRESLSMSWRFACRARSPS